MWPKILTSLALLVFVTLANASELEQNDLLWERQKRVTQMGDVIEETQKVISDSINGKKPLSDDKIRTLKNRLKIFRKERDQAQMEIDMMESDQDL